jgi:hypothetical protein
MNFMVVQLFLNKLGYFELKKQMLNLKQNVNFFLKIRMQTVFGIIWHSRLGFKI